MLDSGSRIDGYILQSYLGSGSFAQVWKAHNDLGEEVALKIYHESAADDFNLLMEREYEEVMALRHPNIIVPSKYGFFGKSPYLICPLCDGNLNQLLNHRILDFKKNKKDIENVFTETELALILRDVSAGLEFLENRKVVHHDIKPSNILYKMDENMNIQCFISDFGASYFMKKTLVKGSNKEDFSNSGYGTYGLSLGYASPEVYKGKPQFASDVFSLGVTIFELATGDLPSKTSNLGLGYLLNHDGELPDITGSFKSKFKDIISRMLDKIPGNRPSASTLHSMSTSFIATGIWPEMSKISTKGDLVYKPYTLQINSNQSNTSSEHKYSFFNNLFSSKKNLYFLIAGVVVIISLLFLRNLKSDTKALDDVTIKEFLVKRKYDDYVKELEAIYKMHPDEKLRNNIGAIKSGIERYSEIRFNQQGIGIVEENGLFGIIDQEFKEVIKPEWRQIKVNSKLIFVKSINDLYGAYDLQGRLLLKPEYSKIILSDDASSLEAITKSGNHISKSIN